MMAEEYGAVRHVREINPFQQELEMFYLPACRVIGVEQTYGPKPCGDRAAAPQWQRVIASKEWKAIATLPLSNILRLGVVFVSIAWRNKRLFTSPAGGGVAFRPRWGRVAVKAYQI
jgi:hypothetical protein